MKPTNEQLTIIKASVESESSITVNALAGAAKTTTMVLCAEALSTAFPQKPILALAFNSRIKEEMARRLPPSVTCLTLNGLGHRAWMRATGKRLIVDTKKSFNILKEQIKSQGLTDFDGDDFAPMLDLIASCKLVGMVPEGKDVDCFSPVRLVPNNDETWSRLCTECDLPNSPTTIALAKACLRLSIAQAYTGLIDFDDQIYMSVCFNAPYPKFPLVLVDEAQDLSSINHRQVVKTIESKGRVIVFGDRHQSIYAFRGADSLSMDKLSELFNCEELTLSTTFRCAQSICELVREHVPNILARPNAPQGEVVNWQSKPEVSIRQFKAGSAILCRNNAPLITLAGCCLRNSIPVKILGREIGKGLIRVLKKLCLSEVEIELGITAWANAEIYEAQRKDNPYRIKHIEDQRDCLLGLAKSNPKADWDELIAIVSELFSDKDAMLTFATGHKSKGLEFDTVYHLDPWLIGARNQEGLALLQEQNLEYVINTRAKNTLIFFNLKQVLELEVESEEDK